MPPCAGPPAGATTPVVQSASARPTTFAVDTRGPGEVAVGASSAKHAARGTTLRYSLSEAARTTFTIERRAAGRRSGKKCVKPTRKNRSKKRCARFTLAGRFALQSIAGANRHHFSGRIGARKLIPGNYRVTLVASNAANKRSVPKSFNIKVVPK